MEQGEAKMDEDMDLEGPWESEDFPLVGLTECTTHQWVEGEERYEIYKKMWQM